MIKRLSVFFLAFAASVSWAYAQEMKMREVLREDFSRFTAGSEEKPSATTVNDELQYIPESKTLVGGWQGVEIYQAGGVAYQGAGGRLFTPDLDLSQNGGTFRVTFRMKLAPGSEAGVANVVHSNIESIQADDLTEEWKTVVLNMTGGVKDDYLCIRGVNRANPTKSQVKVFIDDIVVEVPDPNVPTPSSLGYGDFDGSSFTVSWHKVSNAEKYELCLYTIGNKGTEVPVDENVVTTATTYTYSGLEPMWHDYYVKVRALASDEMSPWSVPVLVEGLPVPELKEEKNVTDDGFTVSWNPVNNVYVYEGAVYYEHHASADEQFYHADTSFDFVKQMELTSQFDVGFDELPGWFFGAALLEDGYVGIQGAMAYLGFAAQIESPALQLSSSGGKISVEFKAKNDDNRTGLAVALYNPFSGDYVLADSYECEISKNWSTVRASLSGGVDGSILAIIPTRSGNVYVDDLKVWQNIKEGAAANLYAKGISTAATAAKVAGLACPEGDYVSYKIRAKGISSDQTRWIYSAYTAPRYPYGSASVKDIVEEADSTGIIVDGREITASGIGITAIFDLSGRCVATGLCGTPVAVPSSGIYIVRTPRTSQKVLIK